MEGHEKAYDFHQLVNILNTLNGLTSTKYKDNELNCGRVYNQVKNVWANLHLLIEGEFACNTLDDTIIATDDDMTSALSKGLKENLIYT